MWITEAILILRNLIDDLDSANYTYTDARLGQLIIIAACMVMSDIGESDNFDIDITAQTITPDPDDSITKLITLLSVCKLTRSEAKSKSSCDNIKIIDGPSTIQTQNAYKAILEVANTFCSDYEREKTKYNMTNSGGCVSITPTTTYNC